jgi:hypothetical protein
MGEMDFVVAATRKRHCSLFGREHLSPGCIDLMRHAGVRVHTRLQELRLIEDFGWTRKGLL